MLTEKNNRAYSESFPRLLTLLTATVRLLACTLPPPPHLRLWAEMDWSACLSFEVLWLSAKRGVVPAAICEGAAGSRSPLRFPSVTVRGPGWGGMGGGGGGAGVQSPVTPANLCVCREARSPKQSPLASLLASHLCLINE